MEFSQADGTVPPRPANVSGKASVPKAARQQAVVDAPEPTRSVTGNLPVVVKDVLGRTLKVRKLGIHDRMKMLRILGSELSKNEPYVGVSTLAFALVELDGEPMAPIKHVSESEFIVQRLGDEGADAIGRAYVDNGWIPQSVDLDAAKN